MIDMWGLMTESRIETASAAARPGFIGIHDRIDGFTLLEVMLAVAIIAIVMTAVFRLQGQTVFMAGSTRFHTTAMLLAQQKMAESSGSEAWEVSGGGGDFGDDYPGFSWNVSVSGVESAALGETGKDLRRIDVAIFFKKEGREYRLREYRLFQD